MRIVGDLCCRDRGSPASAATGCVCAHCWRGRPWQRHEASQTSGDVKADFASRRNFASSDLRAVVDSDDAEATAMACACARMTGWCGKLLTLAVWAATVTQQATNSPCGRPRMRNGQQGLRRARGTQQRACSRPTHASGLDAAHVLQNRPLLPSPAFASCSLWPCRLVLRMEHMQLAIAYSLQYSR